MQDLVEDLLRYSRVTSKPRPTVRFNLGEAVKEAATDLLMLREETGGQIEIGELPDIQGDRIQIRQLFQNLLGNSLKYRGENPPVVKVYDRSSASSPYVEICVKDNGIGFNQEYLEKIFKPFQRLHGRTAPLPGHGDGAGHMPQNRGAPRGEHFSREQAGRRRDLHREASSKGVEIESGSRGKRDLPDVCMELQRHSPGIGRLL